ncbi:MAG: 4-hydroxy-tetrahydrodipicolinate reductase [Chloroflexota bacterium]
MKPVRVAVSGAQGRMGREIIATLCLDGEVEVVGATELNVTQDSLTLPSGKKVPFSSSLEQIIKTGQPEVVVDFTTAKACLASARIAIPSGVRLVIGTTGLTQEEQDEIRSLAAKHRVGVVMAPNFAVGAVLMIHLAQIAAKYLDSVEIIELHHDLKADSPSGTALTTAGAIAASRAKPFKLTSQQRQPAESRGQRVGDITIHSVRLPGLVAHQEVLFGGVGQTLSIRHDSIGRQSFMPGILLAIKEVGKYREMVYGLERLLGL